MRTATDLTMWTDEDGDLVIEMTDGEETIQSTISSCGVLALVTEMLRMLGAEPLKISPETARSLVESQGREFN